MTAKAYSYIRFSKQEQIKGDSLRRQSDAAEKWCRANNVELVENYRDLGVSAFKGKNSAMGALGAFLKLARDGKIPKGSYLVVESLDRISRMEIMDALSIFTDIIKAGINLVTLSDNQVYTRDKINDNPLQLIISITVLSRANEESRTKSMRVGQAWANKRDRLSNGEKMTARCVTWCKLRADRKIFDLIPARAALVKRMFEMAASGSGAMKIARILNNEKIPPFSHGKCWHLAQVCNILNTRAVIGEFQPFTHKNGTRIPHGEPIQDYYPPVISKELFATVSQIIKSRKTGLRGRTTLANPFSKLAFDRATDTPMNYQSRGNFYYLISWAARRGLAKWSSWRFDDFKKWFIMVALEASIQDKPEGSGGNELPVKQMELSDCEKQIEKWIGVIERTQSPSAEMKLRDYESKRLQLKKEIADLENESSAKPNDISSVNWKDDSTLRDNLRATVKRITVDAGTRCFAVDFFDGRRGELKTLPDGTWKIIIAK